MPKFNVFVSETLEYEIEVDAPNAEAAEQLAETQFLASPNPFKYFGGSVVERDFSAEKAEVE